MKKVIILLAHRNNEPNFDKWGDSTAAEYGGEFILINIADLNTVLGKWGRWGWEHTHTRLSTYIFHSFPAQYIETIKVLNVKDFVGAVPVLHYECKACVLKGYISQKCKVYYPHVGFHCFVEHKKRYFEEWTVCFLHVIIKF